MFVHSTQPEDNMYPG